MKSTYTLLTICLDRLPIPSCRPVLKQPSDDEIFFDCDMDFCLFDYRCYQRVIRGSMILSCRNQREVNSILDSVAGCDFIWFLLDYWSEVRNASKLFVKRCLQVMELVNNLYPEKDVGFIANTQLVGYSNIIDEFYEN
ncbi:MAG: hypothetical protein IKR78_04615 [Dehalococcoidales bacterium]|nr:hypothetical protein [Dehalococcoidales bacterium]